MRYPKISTILCYHCKSTQTSKAGFTKNGKQRYYCRDCRRFSRENPSETKGKLKRSSKASLPSKGHLILELQAISQRLKKTPTTSDINKLSKKGSVRPLAVYYAVFGSFTEAIAKAKLPPRYKQTFDKDKLIKELQTVRRSIGRALISKDIQAARVRGEVSSIYHFQRAFGSVPLAIAAASADRRLFTKAEILDYLRRLYRQLQRVPTGRDVASAFVPGKTPSFKEILRSFKTLKRARSMAGISYDLPSSKKGNSVNWQRYTPNQLAQQLAEIKRDVGRWPTDRDLNRASRAGKCASAATFRRAFGGLKEAYEAVECLIPISDDPHR